jgi:hypothetical protein
MIWLGIRVEKMSNTSELPVKMYKRRHMLLYILLIICNILLFSWTSPLESPAVIVIGGFIVASLDLWVIVHLFVRFLGVVAPKARRFSRRLTVAFTSFGIITLALASLGQLTWRDLIVVIIIWLLGYMYSLRFNLNVTRSS